MKKIDSLVLKELIGPWLFGVAMFSSLLIAATYLMRITDYIVRGLPPGLILKITMLLMPAILAKTFAMAVLLAALLAFGRLSSDSEVTAMRAAGASLKRIVQPVALFSLLVAVVTFFFNNGVVPPAEAQAQSLVLSIENKQKGQIGQQVTFPLPGDDYLRGQVVAQAFDLLNRKLYGVTVIAYDRDGRPTFYMHCKELEYRPQTGYWHMRGGADILPANGGAPSHVEEAWPDTIPRITYSPEDIDAGDTNAFDKYSMAEILRQMNRGKRDGTLTPDKLRNFEFGYWNKISVALAALIFGPLGAVLGIRQQRTSASSGFALAIAIIFSYFILTNFTNIWARSGFLPPWVASFAPVLIGLACTGVIMLRRNN